MDDAQFQEQSAINLLRYNNNSWWSAKSNQKLCGTNALVETAHIPTKRVEGHFNTLPNVLHHDDDGDDDDDDDDDDDEKR